MFVNLLSNRCDTNKCHVSNTRSEFNRNVTVDDVSLLVCYSDQRTGLSLRCKRSTSYWSLLSRVYTRTHVAGDKLYPLVSTCRCRRVTCIVASLSLVCCWIQRDTSRPWHKWIVIMSPRYSQHVFRTSNLYSSTCSLSVDVSGYELLSSRIHVSGRHVSWCKRGTRLSDSLIVNCT